MSIDAITAAIKREIDEARAEAYAEGVRDGENKTGDGLYRRLLIEYVLSRPDVKWEDKEVPIEVDFRVRGDPSVERCVIVDCGLDPMNGMFYRYILRRDT